MTATILDGKKLSAQLQEEIAQEVAQFQAATGVTPVLAAILVGDDPASQVYIRNKRRACERVGIESRFQHLPEDTTQDQLLALVEQLNNDPAVHGILVQLPLPKQIEESSVLALVRPAKDVDAFHAENVGLIVQGQPRFLPCTPQGIQQLLVRAGIETSGAHVVVVGRSDIVGKPIANMLVQRAAGANATVTICHSQTRNLADITRLADILIVAIGKPNFITAEMVKRDAVVIDVGINRTENGLCGDVDFAGVKQVAGAITPVPGGVGPLTITMLLKNTLAAARQQQTD